MKKLLKKIQARFAYQPPLPHIQGSQLCLELEGKTFCAPFRAIKGEPYFRNAVLDANGHTALKTTDSEAWAAILNFYIENKKAALDSP